jgi:hypothetical protein
MAERRVQEVFWVEELVTLQAEGFGNPSSKELTITSIVDVFLEENDLMSD